MTTPALPLAGDTAWLDWAGFVDGQARTAHPARPAGTGILATLERGVRSGCLAVVGDSTGTDTDEWFGILGQRLGADFPAYTVLWRQWNDTAVQDYGPPETLQTGTGGGERGAQLASGTMRYLSASQFVGDQDVRAKVKPAVSWVPGGAAAIRTVLSRYNASASNRGWIFGVDEAGLLTWTWSSSGAADVATVRSTVPVGFAGSVAGWVRCIFDVDNGAAGNTATFQTSADNIAWTTLGAPVVTAGVTTVSAAVTDYMAGGHNSVPTAAQQFDGTIYWVEIRPGGAAAPSVVPPLLDDWEQATTAVSVTFVGAPVLMLLCGSISGRNIPYFDDATRRQLLHQPHGQDLVFVSTGHNDGNSTNGVWITAYSTLVTNVRARVPGVPLVPVTQNPTTVPIAAQQTAARSARGASLMTWAASQAGVWAVDTYPAFTDLAVQVEVSDGLHPTQGNGGTSGSDVWADLVYEALFA